MRKSCKTCDLGPHGSNACVSDIVAKQQVPVAEASNIVWCGPIERGEVDPVTLAYTNRGELEEEDSVDMSDLARGLIGRHSCGGTNIHPEVQRLAAFLEDPKKRGRPKK